jgi:hypothetical protein
MDLAIQTINQTITRRVENNIVYFYFLTKREKFPRVFRLMKCNYAQSNSLTLFILSNKSWDITVKKQAAGWIASKITEVDLKKVKKDGFPAKSAEIVDAVRW